jgi:lipase chaperone LimK
VKTVNFNTLKKEEARSRMTDLRAARRNPSAARKIQRRVSLVGNGAKWRITNLNQVAHAIAKW